MIPSAIGSIVFLIFTLIFSILAIRQKDAVDVAGFTFLTVLFFLGLLVNVSCFLRQKELMESVKNLHIDNIYKITRFPENYGYDEWQVYFKTPKGYYVNKTFNLRKDIEVRVYPQPITAAILITNDDVVEIYIPEADNVVEFSPTFNIYTVGGKE